VGGGLCSRFPLTHNSIISKFSHLDEVILVVPKTQKEYWNSPCKNHNFNIPHTSVEGGKTRFHSVKNGLEKVNYNSIVAIHDGVRPLISTKLINSLITEILENKVFYNRLIFDGYPRNLSQAKNLTLLLEKHNQKISCVLSLKVNKDLIINNLFLRLNKSTSR
jgi:adenylate kinase family enzyme